MALIISLHEVPNPILSLCFNR